eukprot:29832-Pelagococcus_subviridis.AAC.1
MPHTNPPTSTSGSASCSSASMTSASQKHRRVFMSAITSQHSAASSIESAGTRAADSRHVSGSAGAGAGAGAGASVTSGAGGGDATGAGNGTSAPGAHAVRFTRPDVQFIASSPRAHAGGGNCSYKSGASHFSQHSRCLYRIAFVVRGVFDLTRRASRAFLLSDFHHRVRDERVDVLVRERPGGVSDVRAAVTGRGAGRQKLRVLVLQDALRVRIQRGALPAAVVHGAKAPHVAARVLLAREAARAHGRRQERPAVQNVAVQVRVLLAVARRDRSVRRGNSEIRPGPAKGHRRRRDRKRGRVRPGDCPPARDDVIGPADDEAPGAQTQRSVHEADAQPVRGHDEVEVVARQRRRGPLHRAARAKRLERPRELRALAGHLERRRVHGLRVRDRDGHAGDVHRRARAVPDDAGGLGQRRVVLVHRGDDAVKDHVEKRRTRAELQVLVRVPSEHERRREQRKLGRREIQDVHVAVRREQRHGVLHRHRGPLLEREQKVRVPADEKLALGQLHVSERHARSHGVEVEDELVARHRPVAAVRAIWRRRHLLRAPAHEHESVRVRGLRRAGALVRHDDAREFKRDGDAAQRDDGVSGVRVVARDDEGDVHLPRGGGAAGGLRVDGADADEVLGRQRRPRRDAELEGAVREVSARGGGGGGGGGSRVRVRGGGGGRRHRRDAVLKRPSRGVDPDRVRRRVRARDRRRGGVAAREGDGVRPRRGPRPRRPRGGVGVVFFGRGRRRRVLGAARDDARVDVAIARDRVIARWSRRGASFTLRERSRGRGGGIGSVQRAREKTDGLGPARATSARRGGESGRDARMERRARRRQTRARR